MKKYILIILSLFVSQLHAQQRLTFESSLETALKKAKSENKLVFVDCQAKWCTACRRVEKEIFTLDSVAKFLNDHFVSVSLDMEKKGEGIDVHNKYRVRALPTFLMLNGDGEEMYRFIGWSPVEKYMSYVITGANPQSVISKAIAAYKTGDRSKSTLHEYIQHLMYIGEDSLAKTLAVEYYNLLSDNDKVQPENWFLFDIYGGPSLFEIGSEQFNYLAKYWKNFAIQNGKEKVESRLSLSYLTMISATMTDNGRRNYRYSKNEFDLYIGQIQGTEMNDKEQLAVMMRIAQAANENDAIQVSKLLVQYIPMFSAEKQGLMIYCYRGMLEKMEKDYKSFSYFRQVAAAVIKSNKNGSLVKEMKQYQLN